jgi:hypothetical protein
MRDWLRQASDRDLIVLTRALSWCSEATGDGWPVFTEGDEDRHAKEVGDEVLAELSRRNLRDHHNYYHPNVRFEQAVPHPGISHVCPDCGATLLPPRYEGDLWDCPACAFCSEGIAE